MNVGDLRARVERWIADDPDPSTRDELRALLRAATSGAGALDSDDASGDLASAALADLADRFSGELSFGTAGLRGILGGGPNRMNRAVVARASWALAREILASVPRAATRVVIVGSDARRLSPELAEDAACILAGAGLRVLLFGTPVPTPLVGFAVKRLGAAAGVVVTASHNPPEYSGYKIYWENAAQVVPPADARIADAIERAPAARSVPRPPAALLRERGLLADASGELEREYVRAVVGLGVHPDEGDRALAIVYTPLHGVGDALARSVLGAAGFSRITSVPEQRAPDGTFPTVAFPNPEEPGAMDLAIAQAAQISADLVLANDPDADRLAVVVPVERGARASFRQLTGNEVGVLLGHYLLTERAASSRPRAVVSTIVSTPMLGRIAADLGVRYEETLTGFKWIADRAIALEREGYEFVFGFEEALGYGVGSVVYDKDGLSAALLTAELAAVLRARGETLEDALAAIARRWGVFRSAQRSFVRQGARGVAAIRAALDALRASPPEALGGVPVVSVSDYASGLRLRSGHALAEELALPKSAVIAFELGAGSGPRLARVVVRPSGTEPKAKVYVDVIEPVLGGEPVEVAASRADAALSALTASMAEALEEGLGEP
jgi:phosphomannomutase